MWLREEVAEVEDVAADEVDHGVVVVVAPLAVEVVVVVAEEVTRVVVVVEEGGGEAVVVAAACELNQLDVIIPVWSCLETFGGEINVEPLVLIYFPDCLFER